MFDFTKFTDFAAGMSQSFLNEGATGASTELLGQLEAHGIDPANLAGLSAGEIASVLAENGLDPSQFLPADLQELAASFAQFDLSTIGESN